MNVPISIIESIPYKGYNICRHGRNGDFGYWVIYSEHKWEGEQGAYTKLRIAK
jgi:hypothetical protein